MASKGRSQMVVPSTFSEQPKSDVLLNNMCESFYVAILDARDKPIITLLEVVRVYIMKRIVSKREVAQKWNQPFGPNIWKLLQSSNYLTQDFILDYCGDMKFKVSSCLSF